MKNAQLKQLVVGAMAVFAAGAANAQSVQFDFNYMATNGKGDFATYGASKVGTLTVTDLADLNLGDGKSGVRLSLTLDNLNQFSTGTGSVFISSFELNFPGTSEAGVGGQELSSLPNTSGSSVNLGNGTNWRYVSGLSLSNVRAGGAIEFAEDGCVGAGSGTDTACLGGGWGGTTGDPSFEQEFNYVAGTFTNGTNSTFDLLNGDNGYTGFTVASLLSNPVEHSSNPSLPDAFAWIKIRSTGGGIANTDANWWGTPVFNAAGGRLNVLSVAVVPEPETYSMMLAGVGLMGFVAARRRKMTA